MKVPVSNFVIESDYRESVDETLGELASSIQRNGLMNEILVKELPDGKYEITAGRRRFRAMTEFLKYKELELNVHFKIFDIDGLIAQFEENVNREDFKPLEAARLVKDIHDKKVEECGLRLKGTKGGGWAAKDTAQLIGRSTRFVSNMLSIARNEELAKGSKTLSEALNRIEKTKMKAISDTLTKAKAEKVDEMFAKDAIEKYLQYYHHMQALDFLESLDDESVDMFFVDPPYAVNLDKITGTDDYSSYDDDPDEIFEMIEKIIPHFYRTLRDGKYIVMWSSFLGFGKILEWMADAGFHVAKTPLVWVKINTPGRTENPDKLLPIVTESAAYAWKGDAELVKKGRSNCFPFPTIKKNRIHVAQKPEGLITDILQVFAYPGDLVVDTFGGSLSTLRACYLSKMLFKGCEKMEEHYWRGIEYTRDWFQDLKQKKMEENYDEE